MVRQYERRYAELDNHAETAPSSVKSSVEELAKYLSKPCQNNEEKARVIYRWITKNINFNVTGYLSGEYGDSSPNGVLASGEAVSSGYAGLFNALCKEVGVECVSVQGYAKGYRNYIVHKYDSINHEWNAVKLDGNWNLVDSTWGAGYVNGKQYFQKYIDEYFMTPPERLITTHFPKNPLWQLLPNEISKELFEDMVAMKPAAYKYGIQVNSHHSRVIELTAKNSVEITLNASKNTQFMINVKELTDQDTESSNIPNASLCQQPKLGFVVIKLCLPAAMKKYNVHIFCKSPELKEYEYALMYTVKVGKVYIDDTGLPILFEPFILQNCCIFTPMSRRLTQQKTSFKIRVPGAKETVVIANGKKGPLKMTQDQIFEGEIDMSGVKHGESVAVFADFSGSLSGICQYKFSPKIHKTAEKKKILSKATIKRNH